MDNIGVGELLEAVDSLCAPQMAAKDIAYSCADCDASLVVRGDREKTVQVLLNLVSNAVKFTPSGGRVTIRTSVPAPGRVLIGVRDTGVGMTAEQIATAFEPYVQFDNTLTRQQKGTGLGLSISRELARGMGGELAVVSEAGVGTELLLTLSADMSRQQGGAVQRRSPA